MDGVSVSGVTEDVLAVSVSEADDEADHRHDRRRPRVVRPRPIPLRWLGKGAREMPVEDRRGKAGQQLVEVFLALFAVCGMEGEIEKIKSEIFLLDRWKARQTDRQICRQIDR